MSDLPPRDATERFITQMGRWGRRIDISFDVDLGELVDGQRVIARGLELRRSGAVFHYDSFPESTPRSNIAKVTSSGTGPSWRLMTEALSTTTAIRARSIPEVAPASTANGMLAIESRRRATRLRFRFEPPEEWTPPEPWQRVIVVDLVRREVVEEDVV